MSEAGDIRKSGLERLLQVDLLLPVFVFYVMFGLFMYFLVYERASALPLALVMIGFFAVSAWLMRSYRTLWIPSRSEDLSALERRAATTTDALSRSFESKLRREISQTTERILQNAGVLVEEKLEERIDKELGSDLISALGKKLSERAATEYQLQKVKQAISDTFVAVNSRVLQYADSAYRHANMYRIFALSLAVIGVLVAAGVLVWWARQPLPAPGGVRFADVALRYAPAYMFVGLCEILALVLFRYQQRSMEQMRYFSNEATNVDMRYAALVLTMYHGSKKDLVEMSKALERTERNFILEKNQRTLEVARNADDDLAVANLLDKIGGVTALMSKSSDKNGAKKARR